VEKSNFLFEIGTEEIPAGYIHNAIACLQSSFTADLQEYGLSFEQMRLYSTPRRLAIKILGIDVSQADQTVEKIGPAKKVAYGEGGLLSKAGQGFLSSTGASEADLYTQSTTKGDYIAVKVFIKGKETSSLLPTFMKNALERITFPKTMRWGEHRFQFARPIRWLLALYNDATVDFSFCGMQATSHSMGNRNVKIRHIVPMHHISDYPKKLKMVKVIADRDERKALITIQLEALSQEGVNVVKDERLLETVTDLVEFPTAVKATFDKRYLSLPSKIITSTLSQNQKYFSVLDNENKLKNEFIFISNGDPAHSELIRLGNEKVVNARLADARFYFTEDVKKPLESYTQKLGDVVFHAKLGTLLDKTDRITALGKYIAQTIHTNKAQTASILRTARLAKADLVTTMLGEKEFTKLQGYIGMNYALLSGEKPEAALAIYEHYMPRGQNDDLPSNIIGAVIAIADKIDTVCGIIGIGLLPTGSADPFAIRRSANGIIQIIDKFELKLSLSQLVDHACSGLRTKVPTIYSYEEAINTYLKQRIKWFLETQGIDPDVAEALWGFNWDDVLDVKSRARDLQYFKELPDFEVLVSGYKRVSNILSKNQNSAKVEAGLLKDAAELKLFQQLKEIQKRIEPLLAKMDYTKVLEEIVPLGKHIDTFFDKVLVMCEDEQTRSNRLALLHEIRELFLTVADISQISYENKNIT